MNTTNHLHDGSKTEAQDELADEPPIRNIIKSKTIWSPIFKSMAIGLVFLAQLTGVVFSTSVDNQRDPRASLAERHAISHQVTQQLQKRSTTPSAMSIILIPILVLASGLFAGLTIGYMSLDSTQLAVLAKSGTPSQRVLAQKVEPLRRNGHMLLITLLIANMIANETLPIVSEKALGGGVQAIIISTVLVIIFSEIIPQTVCATYALQIGAACAKPVQLLIYLFYPIVWPISSLLTKILGVHSGMIYRPAELKELVNLHSRQSNHGGDLAADVVTIIGSAIDLQERVVEESMTSLNNCFMLNIDTQLNYETMSEILASGHSRIPVYEDVVLPSGPSRRIVGALLTKQLILIDPEDGVLLREFPLNPLPHVASDMPLLNILNSFQEGRSHLAVVCPSVNILANVEVCQPVPNELAGKPAISQCPWWSRIKFTKKANPPQEDLTENRKLDALSSPMAIQPSKGLLTDQPMGIISLEDVLEALLNEPIYDETDLDEHGHMAVPPYVPPEAYAALRKPNSYPVPSPLYESKAFYPSPHELSQDALQIETEGMSTNASTNSPHISKTSSSNRSFQAYQFESPKFTNLGVSYDLGLTGSLPSTMRSDDSKGPAPLEICESSHVAFSETAKTSELSKDFISHENEIPEAHLPSSTSTGAPFSNDHSSLILGAFGNHNLNLTSAFLPDSHGKTPPVDTKEPVPDSPSKNQSHPPSSDNLATGSQTEMIYGDVVH